ncbi:MAG TPA: DUF1549 and DUF1553 domain-containing protein, partial [Verrucomicrobiae bacterium]|nr:DUF1549 and DUF1553 domain-containing protein [Verrucomicrobiae bacterium]
MLESPRYGERWARHWLDLARYAESEGFKADETRPNVWRYRDYVIKSFNDDKPYDRFVQEQIAGDEMWPTNTEAKIATGFNRHYPDESNARNLMQRRQDILNDITDTVGAVFTGLTYGCARCHDHKFDPILQSDYFRLQAFFANTAADDNIPLADVYDRALYRMRTTDWEQQTKEIREEMETIAAPIRQQIIKDHLEKYPAEIQAALAKPEGERTPYECQMAAKAMAYMGPKSHQYIGADSYVVQRLKGETRERWDKLAGELERFRRLHPGPMVAATGMVDLSEEAPKTYLLKRGNWDAPKELEIEPGFLQLVSAKPAEIVRPAGLKSTGRRTALAKLLTDPANPLTARVMANRIWHYHFGRGIVGTPSDFGLKGDRPTHPELLDWLATEFVKNDWSVKYMHRLIMTSETYKQASLSRAEAVKTDPDDKLLWRFPRHRLEGEVIRDSALAVSGLLNTKMGGPSVFPELPTGLEGRGGWKVTRDAQERNRRSIYVFVRRNTRYPMFETFDMPDTHESCARRNVTTSPLQALTMLNDKLTVEWAESFAGRVLKTAGSDETKQVKAAYELAFAREPKSEETEMVKRFFAEHSKIVKERVVEDEPVSLPGGFPENGDKVTGATLVDFCHALLNSNEFVYVN